MITCPHCGKTLPAHVLTCQFCGGDVRNVHRPKVERDSLTGVVQQAGAGLSPNQIVQVWVGLGAAWVLAVLWSIGYAINVLAPIGVPAATGVVVLFNVVRLAVAGVFTARVKVAESLLKGFAWIGAVISALSVAGGVLTATTGAQMGVGIAVANALALAVHVGVLWIIRKASEDGLVP
jgi:hypothetical protein